MSILDERHKQLELYAEEYLKESLRDAYMGKRDLKQVFPACTVLKKHDDGDLTLECSNHQDQFVVTREGKVFVQWAAGYFLSDANSGVAREHFARIKRGEAQAAMIKAAHGQA